MSSKIANITASGKRIIKKLRIAEVWQKVRTQLQNVFSTFSALNRKTDRQWQKSLKATNEQLEVLITSTEDEFLRLGEQLQVFCKRADGMSDLASSVAQQMSGDEIQIAVRRFQDVFDNIKQQDRKSEQDMQGLSGVLDMLDRLDGPLMGFDEIVKVLNVLAVYTQIENARITSSDTGFDTLAEEIRKLAVEIKSKAEEIINRTTSLRPMITKTIEKIQKLKNIQRSQARTTLENTTESLTALSEQHRLSSHAAKNIAEQYDAVYEHVREIVVSTQFHDITRQRFEHVKASLEDVDGQIQELSVARLRRSAGDRAGVIGNAGEICRLESMQLNDARDIMVDAVERIIVNLQDLRSTITSMCKEIHTIAGNAELEGDSFFTHMRDRISVLTRALSDDAKTRKEVSSAMELVAVNVREMSEFVREIELTGRRIERIALNAQVRAAHIGDEGAALGELSEAIQGLSSDTREKTASITENFTSIVAAAERLFENSGSQDDSKVSSEEQMIDELNSLLHNLNALKEQIRSELDNIDNEGRTFATDIERTADSIQVHDTVSRAVETMTETLDRVVSECAHFAPPTDDDSSPKKELVEALKDRYTMEREREVHDEITVLESADDLLAVPEGEAGEEKKDDDLGDNVELF